jgi:hypothetical protein
MRYVNRPSARVQFGRVFQQHGYPPDLQDAALKMVLQ